MTIQATEVGLDGMLPENLTPTSIKMIPRVLPNQKERFETEEIFKRNAQTSEASKNCPNLLAAGLSPWQL